MKTYTTSDGKVSFKAENTQQIVDAMVEQSLKYRLLISEVCMWIEGAYIVLEHGNVETFMKTFPSYKQHIIELLESRGVDTSVFGFAIKDDKNYSNVENTK